MAKTLKVGLTQGDINGIGYETIARTFENEDMLELCTPVLFGYKELVEKCIRDFNLENIKLNVISDIKEIKDHHLNILTLGEEVPQVQPGHPSEVSGRESFKSLEKAVEALKEGGIDIIVTAPISKEAIQSESFNFPGHTEYLQSVAPEGSKALMILFDDNMKVALLTTHLPISRISEEVTEENILNSVRLFNESLQKDFGHERPLVAVLSLNPHSGDGGLLGSEEKDIIKPAIESLKEEGLLVFGPYAADGFFGNGQYRKFDGVLAIYHDQGLAPFKALSSHGGVNFTAGLPFVRTSPDHGTAFDIAWKGEADESSMREAIYKAIDIFRHRKTFERASSNPLRISTVEKPDRGEKKDLPDGVEKSNHNKPEVN